MTESVNARASISELGRTRSLVVYDHDSDIFCHDWVCIIPYISIQFHGSSSGQPTGVRTEAPLHELVLYRVLQKSAKSGEKKSTQSFSCTHLKCVGAFSSNC